MLNHLRWMAIAPPAVSEALIAHALTRDFYREVEYREEFEQYCDWYHRTATANREEHQRMQRDLNLLAWFNRGRR